MALVVALGGCMSYALPPSPSAAEQELVASTHFPATVGVERYHDPVWSLGLLESLRYTGLFDRVAFVDAIKNPDLIARVREPVRAGEPLWVLPILTLGVIPAIAEDEWGRCSPCIPRRLLTDRCPSISSTAVVNTWAGLQW